MSDELQEALERRAEEEGRSVHAMAIQAIERYPVGEADRATVRKPGAKHAVKYAAKHAVEYAAEHADLLRRLGE
ncbi:CopG family transcriptional regulator [Streptomyces sp. DH37]|uniref:CopG family transcriptional regulator n=1 Tax=Streptomyces sp. DH37 TaxID=3040122 RepID=UPI0024425649|nr:CopG family transcriptional regulator [Streptomyces sp. DH37]MDG9704274.1 CopG family transcriptional regulator [Streptomyces sp. DH37]